MAFIQLENVFGERVADNGVGGSGAEILRALRDAQHEPLNFLAVGKVFD